MSDRDNGMASIKIQVFGSILVPDVTTLSFYYVYIEKWIYIKYVHCFFLECRGLEAQAYRFLQVKHQVHVVDSLSGCTFQ